MPNKLTKTIQFLERALSIYIPIIAFVLMFSAFCIQIFSRYFLSRQFEWTYEYTVGGFLWTVAFGACGASKNREHVSFSLLYDKLKPKGQAIMTLAGNILITIAFLILIYPAYDFISFMSIKVTPVLRVPISFLYAPFLAFIIFSIIYMLKDSLIAVQILRGAELPAETEGQAS
ncbi:MAG: TRAP transporter small permease subunit [Sphaerochaeta sp.]|jgi:TRAP-type C4-dicarboxylate transport system permease small subunit